MKIRSKENIAFVVALLALTSGIADAENIVKHLGLKGLFECISFFIYEYTNIYSTEEQIFSIFWVLILVFLYFRYIRYDEVYGVSESKSEFNLDKILSGFSRGLFGKQIRRIKNTLLNFKFRKKLAYCFVFDRRQFAGEIGPDGENIPPVETYGCEDLIIRIGIQKSEDTVFHEEYRFVENRLSVKVRSYEENKPNYDRTGYGSFIEIKFKLKTHYWLFTIAPLFLLSWYFKIKKQYIGFLLLLVLVLLLII